MEPRKTANANDSSPILIGTWGFDVDGWSPSFYPEELPRDWRFAYYSNWLRAVLLPAESLARARQAELQEWTDDADPDFRFIVELPPSAVDAVLASDHTALDTYIALTAPLVEHIVGYVLPTNTLCRAADDVVARFIAKFGDVPVCAGEFTSLSNDCASRLARIGIGTCWAAEQVAAPASGGRLLVVRTGVGTPAQQRAVLEASAQWQRKNTQVAIFFDDPAKAQQARLLAELMGF